MGSERSTSAHSTLKAAHVFTAGANRRRTSEPVGAGKVRANLSFKRTAARALRPSIQRTRVGQKAFFSGVPNTERDVKLDRIHQVWIGDELIPKTALQ